MNKKMLLVAPATMLAVASLAACGSSPAQSGADTQSVAEACAVLNEEGKTAFESFSTLNPSDPAMVESIIDTANGISAKIHNSEVKSAWDGAFAPISELMGLVDGIDLSNPAEADTAKLEEITTKAGELQTTATESLEKIQTLCPEIGS